MARTRHRRKQALVRPSPPTSPGGPILSYYEVACNDRRGTGVPVVTESTEPRRHLALEGSYNVRDVGGYPAAGGRRTRWRTLFRADSLHALPKPAQAELMGYGVRTIVDLRHPSEVAALPNVLAASSDVRYVNAPLITERSAGRKLFGRGGSLAKWLGRRDGGSSLAPLELVYRRIVDNQQPELRAVLAELARPAGFPMLVHCTAGKDRTGVVIGLALSIAGVPAETVANDYALSSQFLVSEVWRTYQTPLESPPDYMLNLLGHLDRTYGGAAAYARHLGLAQPDVDAIRETLLEP